MSMTTVPPLAADPSLDSAAPTSAPSSRSGFAWEAMKTVLAVTTFTAMFLPVAFPSTAGMQPRVAQTPAVEAPSVAVAKAQGPKVVASPANAAGRAFPAQQPPRKPAPKNT